VNQALTDVAEVFRHWLYLPDLRPLLALLGTFAANQLAGDPVWLLLVGPPGSGKSELLGSIASLPNVHPTATLTEAALLSGTPKRDHDVNSRGGLLRAIGRQGLILCKDFGSVLSMNRDARAAVLAALREVYDGSWTRHVGTDGGRTLSWVGRVGLIAGVTPTIDRHHAVMGAMGERFILFRLPQVDSDEQAQQALSHAGHEEKMRTELATAASRLFASPAAEPHKLTEEERLELVSLTTLVVAARSAVERDSYSREIELIPDTEAPTRLIVVLRRLLDGLDTLGTPRETAWEVVRKAALDSIPSTRRAVMDALVVAQEPVETPRLAEDLGYPTSTTKRALEDLAAHGVTRRTIRGTGQNADRWALTEWAFERYAPCNSVLSSNTRSGSNKSSTDIPESQPMVAA
jgi:hypothetical protein